jgi:hypothetical protein
MNTDKFPNVDKSLGPEIEHGERTTIKDLKDPFRRYEARLCGAWQRQVYGERSVYLRR